MPRSRRTSTSASTSSTSTRSSSACSRLKARSVVGGWPFTGSRQSTPQYAQDIDGQNKEGEPHYPVPEGFMLTVGIEPKHHECDRPQTTSVGRMHKRSDAN